jgi:hypothetical protein
LTLSVTAISCGSVRSLAKACRVVVVQERAPERHASARGTTWSMSTSEAAIQVAPSYGLNHRPDTAAQELFTTTFVPSRLRTVSRVFHAPEMVIQCGNRSRE